MMYGVIIRVPAPREAYEPLHMTIKDRVGDQSVDGFVLHVVRPAVDGYELLEVWDSRDHQFDAFQPRLRTAGHAAAWHSTWTATRDYRVRAVGRSGRTPVRQPRQGARLGARRPCGDQSAIGRRTRPDGLRALPGFGAGRGSTRRTHASLGGKATA